VRELAQDHVLSGRTIRAVAARVDCDDVLFEVLGSGYAVVHLTWVSQRASIPRWPMTELFSSFEDWCERRMKPDHDEYGCSAP